MSTGWDNYIDERARREKAEAKLAEATQALQRIGEDVMPDPVRYADLTPEVVRDAFILYHMKAEAEVKRLRAELTWIAEEYPDMGSGIRADAALRGGGE